MEDELIAAVKALKVRFLALMPEKREDISVCLLKCNLGVSTRAETDRVRGFLQDFALDLTSGRLDDFIGYLHAKDNSLPRNLPLAGRSAELPPYENDDTDTEEIMRQELDLGETTGETKLKRYEEDCVDTLPDPIKPLRDRS